jgi:predicted MFS family arabinose efflux permease
MWAAIPFFYWVATPGNAVIMMSIAWFLAGISPAGVMVAQTKVTSVLSDRRTMYIAVLAIVVTIGSGLGALSGSMVTRYFGVGNVFIVSLVCRSLSVLPFAFMKFPETRKG